MATPTTKELVENIKKMLIEIPAFAGDPNDAKLEYIVNQLKALNIFKDPPIPEASSCEGCEYHHPSQKYHMGYGGCMSEN